MLDPGAWWGTQLKMGYSYVPPLRPLFHAPPDPSLKPPFQNFLVPQDPTCA